MFGYLSNFASRCFRILATKIQNREEHQENNKNEVIAMEIGQKMVDRDRKRAAHLFRTQSLGKNPDFFENQNFENHNHNFGSFEPDWSKFENTYSNELLPNKKGTTKTYDFMSEVFDVLLDYVRKSNDRSTKIVDFHHPEALKEMMGHCLDLEEGPHNLEQTLSDCKETLKYCVKTSHPRFFNQLSTGLDMIALAGEWLTATANTNMFTYEIAPVFTLMEDIVLTKMRESIGWSEGDGIFAPGGAIANLYAVSLARYRISPETKSNGLFNSKILVLFTSEHAHFSIKRSAAILGIGTENVIPIKTDYRGKMIISELEREICKAKSDGKLPFFVSATAGTTVVGAFDPLQDVADICEKYHLWFHVDGAWGGSAIISNQHKHLLNGVERADSMTWNPHKLMGIILQCSAILVKEKGLLEACNSMHATYLFQKDKHYDLTYDTGDKAIQCGRHNDVFKLWLTWRAKGNEGFEKHINYLIELSRYLQKKIKERDGFKFAYKNPEFINVCFWYIPKNLRDLPEGKEFDEKINNIAPKIKAMMMEKGSTMVGYQPLNELPNFFRMITSNTATTFDDIDFLIDEIEKLGEEI